MITRKKLKELSEAAEKKGYEVKVRDVAFVVLCDEFEDKELAYRVAYGDECNDISSYMKTSKIQFLNDYVKYVSVDSESKQISEDRMSFEENKRELIKLIKDIETAMENGEIEKKDGYARIVDIRTKLNDKFNVNENKQNRFIIVESKFNDICPYCGHEIRTQTKEELMAKYNLVEKDNVAI